MTDFQCLSQEHDTSVEILWALAEHYGDREDEIRDALANPPDFDAIVAAARADQEDDTAQLRWQGHMVV